MNTSSRLYAEDRTNLNVTIWKDQKQMLIKMLKVEHCTSLSELIRKIIDIYVKDVFLLYKNIGLFMEVIE